MASRMPLRMRTSRVHPTSYSSRHLHGYERARETVPGTSRARVNVPFIDDDEDVDSDLESYVPRREAASRHRSRVNVAFMEEAPIEDNEERDPELRSYARRLEEASRQRSRANVAFIDDDEDGESEMESDVRRPYRSHDDIHGHDDPKRSLMVTLKIRKGKSILNTASTIEDNDDLRPSTASSDSTSHTAESSYSFRPKRQKRFRDEPDNGNEPTQAPVNQNKNQPYTHHTISKDRAAGEKTEYDDLLLAELGKKHAHRLVLSDDKLLATRGRNISLRNSSDIVEDLIIP